MEQDAPVGGPSERSSQPPQVQGHVETGVPILSVVVGLALAAIPTFIGSFTICGISGCSGGGFGRSTDPSTTLALLVSSGTLAAAPLALYALGRRSIRMILSAALLAVVVSVIAGWLIGSDHRGCPRNVDTATCIEESSGE